MIGAAGRIRILTTTGRTRRRGERAAAGGGAARWLAARWRWIARDWEHAVGVGVVVSRMDRQLGNFGWQLVELNWLNATRTRTELNRVTVNTNNNETNEKNRYQRHRSSGLGPEWSVVRAHTRAGMAKNSSSTF